MRRPVLLLVSVITSLGFVDTYLLIPILALYATELGATVGVAGLIVGAYSISNTVANMPFGRVVDKVGRRFPLAVGLLGDAISMLLYPLCRAPVQLLLVRLSHGVSGAAVGPSTMALMADYAPPSRRGRTMGIYGIALAVSPLIGFLLSGSIVGWLGRDYIFYLGSMMLIGGTALTLLIPAENKRRRPDQGGIPAKVSRQSLGLLRQRGLSIPYVAIFVAHFVFGALATLFPLYVKGYGMTAFHIGLLLAILILSFIALQYPFGVLSDRFDRRIALMVGLGLCALGVYLIPQLVGFTTLILAMIIYGAGYSLVFPSASALIASGAAADERGLATGVFHAVLTAGTAAGASTAGVIAALFGLAGGFYLGALVLVCGLIVTLTLTRAGKRPNLNNLPEKRWMV